MMARRAASKEVKFEEGTGFGADNLEFLDASLARYC